MAAIDCCLKSSKLNAAQEIGERFEVSLPFLSLVEYSLRQSDFELLKQQIEAEDSNDSGTYVLASALLQDGRHEEAKLYVEKLRLDFERELASVPLDKRPTLIIEYVVIKGWQVRDFNFDQFLLKDVILDSFKQCVELEGVGKEIAQSIGGFTPPTLASMGLLNEMMAMLPESEQFVTCHDVDLLIDRIRRANKSDRRKLAIQAMELLKRPCDSKNEFASEIVFEFAVAGEKLAVKGLLGQISGDAQKVWALLQCAKVFPPRHESMNSPQYSQRKIGGVF